MENHILPETDPEVSDLCADIIEALNETLDGRCEVSESSETSEPILELWRGELGGARRFRLHLIEITA
jgi:hypothetical protein